MSEMTPLKIASRAYVNHGGGEAYDAFREDDQRDADEAMQAALLALAECGPSEDMLIATNALNKTPIKDCASEGMTVFRAMLRAIATEGNPDV
jgi:hypothetical protein